MAKRERAAPIVHDDGFTINGCTFHVDPKYKPIDAIGQGSYGVVCSVKNTETDEKLAIKKITPMAGDEWDATHTLREIRLMRCLGVHENIISLTDLSMCQEKDELYMMMELADTDLHRLIQSSCPLTEGHIRVIMFQLLSGVKAMHDNGVLHRDLKPGNLLLNKDCELKITDFGLARMMPKEHHPQSNDDDTKIGSDSKAVPSSVVSPMTEYVVTRWYRPPELMLAPNGCYDGAVDMWSVGCILGELIARKPLFPGTDFMDQLTRVFKVIPIPEHDRRGYAIEKDALKFLTSLPPALPSALEKICKSAGPHAHDLMTKLLCFNPRERMSADEALAHPFFDGVQEEWGEIAPLHLGHSLEFAFEHQSLPLAALRQYICDEVHAFRARDQEESQKKRVDKQQQQHTPESIDSERPQGKDDGPLDNGNKQHESDRHARTQPTVNNPHMKLENDCVPGKGFTIKGCEFNVPPQYKALQVLGEGSYGIVCAASDAITKKNVAIKKITPMAGDEWDAKHTLREIRLMRYFGMHPNIASLQNLSTCTEKDELYIMMDLVDTDLHRLIQSKTKLEEAHVAAIMYQLLCGATTLHENGVLHRDLKPGNILVSKNCDVKITDFGLSRYIPQGGQQSNHTSMPGKNKEGLMTEYVVTRWYRPPEIMLAPNGTYTESVDMWSIGCIFGELLNRRPLFPGTDFIDQLTKVFSVLPVPATADKRGYNVEGDALKFLESLPPCSPSAMAKTFRKASPEAVSLLRRLLCINPERRITAKQALAHPYFKSIRQQLGEPPAFQVAKAFDFEFDQHEYPLAHLKQLIQDEVKLLQRDRHGLHAAASSAPILSAADGTGGHLKQQHSEEGQQNGEVPNNNSNNVSKQSSSTSSLHEKNDQAKHMKETSPTTVDSLSDEEGDQAQEENEANVETLLVESLDSKDEPLLAPRAFLASSASSSSTLDAKQQQKERNQMPEFADDAAEPANSDSDSEYSKRPPHEAHARTKQQQPAADDSEDEQQEIIQVVERVVRRSVQTTTSKLERPKSATLTRKPTATTASHSSRDEDHHPRVQHTSRTSNNHNHHSSTATVSHESSERWGQPRATASSRIHHPVYGATMSTADKRAKSSSSSTTASSRLASSRTSSSSNNQHSARESSSHHSSSEKSDASRHPERASSSHRTSSSSSKTTPTSTKDTTLLPEGWVKKTHSKSGREYYYDTLNKVSSWKHPSKMLENIFGTARVPSTNSSNQHKATSSSSLTPTSADSITPTSSKIATSSSRRTSLSSASTVLPKDWARRTDPKSGRLFYVNLLTNKSFAKLPSSVAALTTSGSSGAKKATISTTTTTTTDLFRKKTTVPQSPQFSQMSWQRKKVPSTDD
uniref:CMGC/MAPK protein kinase n=1 Tax=Globisporangium ultimum (strain ATCC 200006 / CBS 805.95 / DAOM BR144) TaxID=431595 RepID=K3WIV2_GLOUD